MGHQENLLKIRRLQRRVLAGMKLHLFLSVITHLNTQLSFSVHVSPFKILVFA